VTRNGGVDTTKHRRVVTSLSLPDKHKFPAEAKYYRDYIQGITAIDGTASDEIYPWIASKNGTFYSKLVIYKDLEMFHADPFRKDFPLRSATTPTTAVIDIVKYLSMNSNPIGVFVGQQCDANPSSDGHCWAVFVWQDDIGRHMTVRDSNTPGKISSWTRQLAKDLGVKTIKLVPETREERSSGKICVRLTYLAISDLLDGNFNPELVAEGERTFIVASNEFEETLSRKRKIVHPVVASTPKLLRKR
jgi:hypothetical protein